VPPVVLRGQRAWGKIKTTAAEQRELWKQVGEALLVGRRANPSNQGFGAWLKDYGFDDLKRDTRADAMWLAEKWSIIGSPDNDLTHPTNIRKWFNEQSPSPAPEVTLNDSDKPRQRISLETARKINKLSAMAESGEGQEH
jgi:hypothetical protein